MALAHDETMSQSILDFYRSAVPNVAADWWVNIAPAKAPGLVLLLPDPPDVEEMSIQNASQLGAATARLDGLNHDWMAETSACRPRPQRILVVAVRDGRRQDLTALAPTRHHAQLPAAGRVCRNDPRWMPRHRSRRP